MIRNLLKIVILCGFLFPMGLIYANTSHSTLPDATYILRITAEGNAKHVPLFGSYYHSMIPVPSDPSMRINS